MTLGENIKRLRMEKNWSQRKLAKMAGVSQGTIVNIEAGRRKTHHKTVADIAAALGVEFDKLMDGVTSSACWVSSKMRLPKVDGDYVCCGIEADSAGSWAYWCGVLAYKGPDRYEDADKPGTWARAEGKIVTHWLDGLKLPQGLGL